MLRFKVAFTIFNLLLLLNSIGASVLSAQEPRKGSDADPKKANVRAADPLAISTEPFDSASLEKMAGQCVTLETEVGAIEIEMMPEVAPESVRNFLNLAATGALDTTLFSRVVKDFVIQGGNLATNEKWGVELAKRAGRKLPDEPGLVKHVRGIVSMARTDEPNSATTHFLFWSVKGIIWTESSQLSAKSEAV